MPGFECPASPLLAEPEGTFLVSIEADRMSPRIEVLRLAPDGVVLARGEVVVSGPLERPTGPSAVAGDFVFVATEIHLERSSVQMLRFNRGDLSPNGRSVLGPSDGRVDNPQAVTAPGGARVLVFYVHNDDTLRCESCTSGVVMWCGDFATIDWPGPLAGFSAAANGTDWFAFAYHKDREEPELRLHTVSSRSDPLEEPLPLLKVNDVESEEPRGDSDSAALAWTGAGFLVVWAEQISWDIFSSFVELVRD